MNLQIITITGTFALSLSLFVFKADFDINMQCDLNDKIETITIIALETETLVAPFDAPDVVKTTGKMVKGPLDRRIHYGREDLLPARGQLMQGLSALEMTSHDKFASLSDNGFGTWRNSGDALLAIHSFSFNVLNRRIERDKTTFLTDPNHVSPFLITLEGNPARYLTGRDFDPEAMRIIGDKIFIGDEFGPSLLIFDRESSQLRRIFNIPGGQEMISPDNHIAKDASVALIARSRGFEGMAKDPFDNRLLVALETKPKDNLSFSKQSQKDVPVYFFDLQRYFFKDTPSHYPLRHANNSIGDIAFDNKGYLWSIERDQNGGDPEKKCGTVPVHMPCFPIVAKHKRVFKSVLDRSTGKIEKADCLDLLDLPETQVLNGYGKPVKGLENVTSFPFVTIESLDFDAKDRLWISNDNNYPSASGWTPNSFDQSAFLIISFKTE